MNLIASRHFASILALLAGLSLLACGPKSEAPPAGSAPPTSAAGDPAPPAQPRTGPLKITTTIGMIADVAREIGGERAHVTALMGPGVDPHLYKASQSDLEKLTGADLILYCGLHLEGKMADTLVKLARRVPTIAVTESITEDRLREPPEFAGQYDPHVWFDVQLWMTAAATIRDALIEYDLANKAEYEQRATAYLEKMKALDAYAKEQIATIPKEQRVLVTAHDAFGYFGRAYDMEVLGLQGISTATEYGLQDLERLVGIVAERKVKAVFVESSVPKRSIEALVRGAEARGHQLAIGGELFSDAMGAEGTDEGTYLGMVRHNVDTIVRALK